jgi:hypothetical protein
MLKCNNFQQYEYDGHANIVYVTTPVQVKPLGARRYFTYRRV